MAEQLTRQQQMAVSTRGSMLLVSAAAGSGKTKVLVDRLMSYLTDPTDPANLDDFLIITYTKAAATELRGKIAAKLTERIGENPGNRHLQQQMQRLYLAKISTVHAFCADILREYAYKLDIAPDFRVADETECQEIQLRVLDKLLENAYETIYQDADVRSFVDTQGFGRDDRQIPDIILKVYSSARCHLNPEQWLDCCAASGEISNISDATQTVWGSYLITDLHKCLDLHIRALEKCARQAAQTEGMEKPSLLLNDTIIQLKRLREAQLWDEVVKYKDIDYGRLTFSKNCTDLQFVEQIKAVRGACKQALEKKLKVFSNSSTQVLSDLAASADAAKGLIKLVKVFSKECERLKKMRRVLDFGDLEHKMLDLLLGKSRSGATALASEIGNRFREIMVDEYQDSNAVQDTIFTVLTEKRNNCFMVGDVKQSIYQFRLADPGIFIEKYNRFSPVEEPEYNSGRKVLLSSNFRSSGGVISAVNDVFANCMSPDVGGLVYGKEEMLNEGIAHIPLDEPEVELHGIAVKEDTYAEEAAYVADRICQLLDGTHHVRQGDTLRPIVPDDIVILLRSPGSVGGEFRYALECRGIRCTTGSSTDLLQTQEIETLRAFLQIISNPLQDIPLIAVLSSPVFGLTADDLAMLRSTDRHCPFYRVLQNSENRKVRHFCSVLTQLRKEARMLPLSLLVERVFTLTRMDSIFAAMENGECRTANLQAFCQTVSQFEAIGGKDIAHFLEYLDTIAVKGLSVPAEPQSGCVTIMSIHKSKGLEFPVVFLCGLSRGFNQESTHGQVLCDRSLGLGLNCINAKQRVRYPTIAKRAIAAKMITDSISEELRVLYVAMTRARDRLIMTYAAKRLDKELNELALRMDFSDRLLMTSDVDCPGLWVLQTALKRTEAGAFFALGAKPQCVSYQQPPWLIQVNEANSLSSAPVTAVEKDEKLPRETVQRLKDALSFSYPYTPATQTPSKQTATQLKGRFKDQEIAEDTEKKDAVNREFRLPSFRNSEKRGKEYGSSMHAAMQYIRYETCSDVAGVNIEIARLVKEERISEDQAKQIDSRKIANFFSTPMGAKLRSAKNVLREFKFSILEDAHHYFPGVEEERVLLQGVVDCALIEDDGITVIDFKTDYVTDETMPLLIEKYRPQVNAYARALERIYKKQVKSALLYFFHSESFVAL